MKKRILNNANYLLFRSTVRFQVGSHLEAKRRYHFEAKKMMAQVNYYYCITPDCLLFGPLFSIIYFASADFLLLKTGRNSIDNSDAAVITTTTPRGSAPNSVTTTPQTSAREEALSSGRSLASFSASFSKKKVGNVKKMSEKLGSSTIAAVDAKESATKIAQQSISAQSPQKVV
jgi:hypothetical protein